MVKHICILLLVVALVGISSARWHDADADVEENKHVKLLGDGEAEERDDLEEGDQNDEEWETKQGEDEEDEGEKDEDLDDELELFDEKYRNDPASWFRGRLPRVRIPRIRIRRIRVPRIRVPRIRVPRIRVPRIRVPGWGR